MRYRNVLENLLTICVCVRARILVELTEEVVYC
jgi:hypothetical protein